VPGRTGSGYSPIMGNPQPIRRWLRPVVGGGQAPLDDETLIAGVLAGNAALATEFYRRLVHVIDHTLYRVLGGRERDHDDLAQAAFEQVVTTLARRRFAGACSLRTWASSIATRVGLNALRSRRRERAVIDRSHALHDDESLGPARSDGESEILVRADIERLRALMAQINPRRAEVVILHDVLGHDLAEVAVLMDISIAAAQSLLSRSRREFAEGLGSPRRAENPDKKSKGGATR
jgi:RNA polymerase sigma-70 factor, ECF subfamily